MNNYTKQEIDDWLGLLTAPGTTHCSSVMSGIVKQVWAISWRSEQWAIATDGVSMVVVLGEYGHKKASPEQAERCLELLCDPAITEMNTTLPALRKWTGPAPRRKTCETCGAIMQRVCKWEKAPGEILGCCVDCKHLAHALRGCKDHKVDVAVLKSGRLGIRSATMRALLADSDTPQKNVRVFDAAGKEGEA